MSMSMHQANNSICGSGRTAYPYSQSDCAGIAMGRFPQKEQRDEKADDPDDDLDDLPGLDPPEDEDKTLKICRIRSKTPSSETLQNVQDKVKRGKTQAELEVQHFLRKAPPDEVKKYKDAKKVSRKVLR